MTFRFYLQPAMAALAALPDGIRDARLGHKSFFWSAWWDRNASAGRLREGAISTARVVLLGLSMDVIYQFKVLDRFYPGGSADDGDPARRHSLLHLPLDRRARRPLVVRAKGTGALL